MYFFSLFSKKKILLDFFGFCISTFSILETLLLEVIGIVLFVFVNSFHFHRCTIVVRLD